MPAPALPQIPDKTFRVSDYGTRGDGKTNDTEHHPVTPSESAEKAGGGTVEFFRRHLPHQRRSSACSGVGLRLDHGAPRPVHDQSGRLSRGYFTRLGMHRVLQLLGPHHRHRSARHRHHRRRDNRRPGGRAWWPWKDKAAASQEKTPRSKAKPPPIPSSASSAPSKRSASPLPLRTHPLPAHPACRRQSHQFPLLDHPSHLLLRHHRPRSRHPRHRPQYRRLRSRFLQKYPYHRMQVRYRRRLHHAQIRPR